MRKTFLFLLSKFQLELFNRRKLMLVQGCVLVLGWSHNGYSVSETISKNIYIKESNKLEISN